MNTTKFATLLAAVALSASMAVAQPADDTPTTTPQHHAMKAKHGENAKGNHVQKGDNHRGPFNRLSMARRLDNLSAEQKAKIDKFVEENKEEAKALQKDLRESMQEARKATDRDARREIMEGVRKKMQAGEKKVNTFLKGVLTEEQQSAIQQQFTGLRDRAAKRIRGGKTDDNNTTGAKAKKHGDQARHGKKGDKDKAGKKDGKGKWNKKGKNKQDHQKPAATEDTANNTPDNTTQDTNTSGSTISPFAREE